MTEPEVEDFYRRCFLPFVRRAAWRHKLSEEDARDVVQEAFLLSVTKLTSNVNPTAWFNRTVDLVASNWRRKSRRRALLLERFWSEAESAQDERREAEEL